MWVHEITEQHPRTANIKGSNDIHLALSRGHSSRKVMRSRRGNHRPSLPARWPALSSCLRRRAFTASLLVTSKNVQNLRLLREVYDMVTASFVHVYSFRSVCWYRGCVSQRFCFALGQILLDPSRPSLFFYGEILTALQIILNEDKDPFM